MTQNIGNKQDNAIVPQNNKIKSKMKYKKDRFDPKTLKPFDKLLAKDEFDERWCCDFFSDIDESQSQPYNCIGASVTLCIPYNDETKHLVGTTEEAPGYYRYWED